MLPVRLVTGSAVIHVGGGAGLPGVGCPDFLGGRGLEDQRDLAIRYPEPRRIRAEYGVVRSYVRYFHEDRTHLGLMKDTPIPRAVESPSNGKVVALPRVGGLHHRYSREEELAA